MTPRRFVFVDECSTDVRPVPLRARVPKGQRAFGKAPKNRESNVTLISSNSLVRMGASMSMEGSADEDVFLLYVERFLRPTLKRGQIVVIDNLRVHKMKKVRELMEGHSCSVVFLPSCWPGFNPIEEVFSKMEGLLRKVEARSIGALVQAMGAAVVGDDEGGRRGGPLRPLRIRDAARSFCYENRSNLLTAVCVSIDPLL